MTIRSNTDKQCESIYRPAREEIRSYKEFSFKHFIIKSTLTELIMHKVIKAK